MIVPIVFILQALLNGETFAEQASILQVTGNAKPITWSWPVLTNFFTVPSNVKADTEITDLTLCIRIKFDLLTMSDVVRMTADENSTDWMFGLDARNLEDGIIFIYVNVASSMIKVEQTKDTVILPKRWNHFCYSYESSTGLLKPVWNGRLVHDDIDQRPKIGLTLGNFTKAKITFGKPGQFALEGRDGFSGLISELYVFTELFSVENMLLITGEECMKATDFVSSNKATVFVLDWNSMIKAKSLESRIFVATRSLSLCGDSNDQNKEGLIPFTYNLNFKDATEICPAFGGRVFTPKTQAEIDKILQAFEVWDDSETMEKVCKYWIWTAIHQDADGKSWINAETGEPEVVPWFPGEPNGRDVQQCAMPYLGRKDLEYHDIDCLEPKGCFACEIPVTNFFELRGVPKRWSHMIDTSYSLDLTSTTLVQNGERIDSRYFLQGYQRSVIKYVNGTLNHLRWEIEPINKNFGNFTSFMGLHHPGESITGARLWIEIGNINSTIKLKLTQCGRESFSCHNSGKCIPMSQRCNGNFDCADESDEKKCKIFELPDGYMDHMPPQAENEEEKLEVEVDVKIVSITQVEEIEMKFSILVEVTLHWFDKRVEFNNLKESKEDNFVPEDETNLLWVPEIYFPDSIDLPEEIERKDENILVDRRGEPTPNPLEELEEDLTFEGRSNPMSQMTTYKIDLKCNFDLTMFPFDQQECQLIIKPTLEEVASIQLVPRKYSYSGHHTFFQYAFGIMEPENKSISNQVKFNVRLRRNYYMHLAITFLPSLSLIIIAELTLFVDRGHFEATIMVALTTMLVLYTLYQSIAATLPQTAYLKMIDIWLSGGLMIPFLVFLCLMGMEIFPPDKMAHRFGCYFQIFWMFVKAFLTIGTVIFVLTFVAIIAIGYEEESASFET